MDDACVCERERERVDVRMWTKLLGGMNERPQLSSDPTTVKLSKELLAVLSFVFVVLFIIHGLVLSTLTR